MTEKKLDLRSSTAMCFMIGMIIIMMHSFISSINAQSSSLPKCSGKVFVSEGTTPCGVDSSCNMKTCSGGWNQGQKQPNGQPVLFNYCSSTGAVPSNNCTTYTDDAHSVVCGTHGYCKIVDGKCVSSTFTTFYFGVFSDDSPCVLGS